MAIDQAKLDELATAPKTTSTDEGIVTERTMKDVIDADRYAASKSATCRWPFGMCVATAATRGTCGGEGMRRW